MCNLGLEIAWETWNSVGSCYCHPPNHTHYSTCTSWKRAIDWTLDLNYSSSMTQLCLSSRLTTCLQTSRYSLLCACSITGHDGSPLHVSILVDYFINWWFQHHRLMHTIWMWLSLYLYVLSYLTHSKGTIYYPTHFQTLGMCSNWATTLM